MCHLQADVQEEANAAYRSVGGKATEQQLQAGDRSELLSQGARNGLPGAVAPGGKPRCLDRKAEQGFCSPDFDDRSSEFRQRHEQPILLLMSEPGLRHRAGRSLTTRAPHVCSGLGVRGGEG